MELANQLEHKVNYMALDALRNLFIQAHLIDKPELARGILELGLFAALEQVISKAINQLQFLKDHPSENTRTRA